MILVDSVVAVSVAAEMSYSHDYYHDVAATNRNNPVISVASHGVMVISASFGFFAASLGVMVSVIVVGLYHTLTSGNDSSLNSVLIHCN